MRRNAQVPDPSTGPDPAPRPPWRLAWLGLAFLAVGFAAGLHTLVTSHHPAPLASQGPCPPGERCPQSSAGPLPATEPIKQVALNRFRQGDPEGAVAALAPLRQSDPSAADTLQDALRSNWNRNRLEASRAERLAAAGHWWEALDALNRLDHPWWQRHSQELRRRVEAKAAALEQEHEHHSHGSTPEGGPPAGLDAEIQRRLRGGQPQWQAFQEGCATVGGQVHEEGPEVTCMPRRGQQGP